MLLAAPRARAQDLAGDVYADAKDIITELIERDLAESLSADMGCYSPKGLLKYFPNTLQSVYERNFGAVKDQLRTETIRFATNYAFECFRQSRTIPLDQFLPIVDFDPHNADTETCRKDTEAAGGPANYQAALAQQAAVRGEPYYPIDRCDPTRQKKQAAGATPEPRVVNALCPFVTALDSAAGGKAKDPLTLAANAAAASAFANWTYYVLAHAPQGAAAAGPPKLEDVVTGLEKMRGSVTEELVKRTSTGSFADDGLLIGFGAQGLNDQFELLANFEEVFALKASESTIAGALVFLLRSQAPRFTVNGTENSDLAALVRQPWFASLASDAGDAPGVTLARALLVSAGVVAHGVVKVSSSKAGVDFIWESGATSPPTFVGLGLGRLVEIQSMARHAAELERFVTAALGSKVDPAVAEVIVRATIGLVQFIDDTRAALKAIPRAADGSIDLVAVLDAILIPDKQTGFCPPPDPSEKDPKLQLSLCGILRQAAATADSENILRPILSAALNRDYRRLAVVATDAVFSRASIETICCGKPDSCTLAAELYGRLARSIVSYVLMPRGDEDQSIAARAAFKSAAIDVLREVGKRGGVERKPAAVRFVLPTFALRASWSSSYQVSDPDHRSTRFVPTVDWPSFRVQVTREGATPYVGLTLSAIDVLAPLAEVVSRDAEVARMTDKQDSLVWATLIHPRASIQVAMPALTKNTALVLSGGIRGAGIFKREAGYTYVPIWGGSNLSAGHLLWPLVEVSAGVQYVP